MKLKGIHKKLKEEHSESVIIIKYGNFYRVFGDDTYILWKFTKYKIHDSRLGFPKEVLPKIKDILNTITTNYLIYENQHYKKYPFVNNQYNIVLKLSKREYQKSIILDKLKDYDCLEDVEILLEKYE